MNKSTATKLNPLYVLIMMCLFCATLNIFDRYFIFLFLAAAMYLMYTSRIIANGSVALLAIYAVSMFALGPVFRGSAFSMMKPFVFPISFIIGYGLFSKESAAATGEKKFNNAIILLVVLAAGALVHYLLN